MSSLLQTFQSFRRILCICPSCGEMIRLSELHLRYTGKAPKTWLDEFESRVTMFQQKKHAFKEKEDEMTERSIERGRKQVPALIRKCLCPEFRQLKYNPYEIKAIMHPVDFVVFDGLNEGELNGITFLSRKTKDKEQKTIVHSIERTIANKDYDWKVTRISTDGRVSME